MSGQVQIWPDDRRLPHAFSGEASYRTWRPQRIHLVRAAQAEGTCCASQELPRARQLAELHHQMPRSNRCRQRTVLAAATGRAGRRRPAHRQAGPVSLRARWPCRCRRRPHGSWLSCPRTSGRWLAHPPPFSAGGRAVRLGRRGIDGLKVLIGRDRTQSLEEQLPDLAPRPSVPAVVDGRVRAINRRAVAPPAAGTQHVDDAAQNAPVIDPPRARLIAGKTRLDCRPLAIAQPKLIRHVILLHKREPHPNIQSRQ